MTKLKDSLVPILREMLSKNIQYKTILHTLKKEHDIIVTKVTLKRFMKSKDLAITRPPTVREKCDVWLEDISKMVRSNVQFADIMKTLKVKYGVFISRTYLKTILADNGIFKMDAIPSTMVDAMVSEELVQCGDIGYRKLTTMFRTKYGVNVSRDAVMVALRKKKALQKSQEPKELNITSPAVV